MRRQWVPPLLGLRSPPSAPLFALSALRVRANLRCFPRFFVNKLRLFSVLFPLFTFDIHSSRFSASDGLDFEIVSPQKRKP